MTVKIIADNKAIQILDEAKNQRWILAFVSAIQYIVSSFQVANYWGEFQDYRLYVFIVLCILFGIGFIYFLLYNSGQKTIKPDEIKFFKIKNICGIIFYYIKLNNGKVRQLYIKNTSEEFKIVKQYCTVNNISMVNI